MTYKKTVQYISKIATKKNYEKFLSTLIKTINSFENLPIDSKRNIGKNDKNIVWELCTKIAGLDPNVFRLDVLGNLVIRGIKYTKNNANRVFALEYEHLKSYSLGGQSIINNIVILVAGINKVKGARELIKYNRNEMSGLSARHGITPEYLLEQLENNFTKTCEKYNLDFKKIGDMITVDPTISYNQIKATNEIANKVLEVKVVAETALAPLVEVTNAISKTIQEKLAEEIVVLNLQVDKARKERNDIIKVVLVTAVVISTVVVVYRNRKAIYNNAIDTYETIKNSVSNTFNYFFGK
jgi:5-methylcytosine-specific restriction endonuclease McrA